MTMDHRPPADLRARAPCRSCFAARAPRFQQTSPAIAGCWTLFQTPSRRSFGIGIFDIGNPVALPARKPVTLLLAVEIRRAGPNQRPIYTFERIDVDDRVHPSVDAAGDDGYEDRKST